MDELEISGKRYLSSRRAAKENHYHADYIGQLIRSGKVIGTKVGRAWYVEEESLGAYFAGEGATLQMKDTSPTVESMSNSFSASIHKNIATPEKKIFITTPEKFSVVDAADAEPFTPSVVEKKEPALRYIADSEPLFPFAQQTRSQIFEIPQAQPTRHTQVPQPPKRNVARKSLAGAYIGVCLLSLAVCGAVLLLSANVASVVTVEQGKPASVGFMFK